MHKFVRIVRTFFEPPTRPDTAKARSLSRHDVLRLVAQNKLSPTQAKALMARLP